MSMHSAQEIKTFHQFIKVGKDVASSMLEESEAFKRENDGSAAVLMMLIQDGKAIEARNAQFMELTRGAEKLTDQVLERKLLWVYLMVPLFAHEDRPLFVSTVAEIVFAGGPRRITHLVKVYTATSEISLYIMTVKSIKGDNGGIYIVFRFEKAPPSRHLTERPGHTRLATWRKRPLGVEPVHAAMSTSAVISSIEKEDETAAFASGCRISGLATIPSDEAPAGLLPAPLGPLPSSTKAFFGSAMKSESPTFLKGEDMDVADGGKASVPSSSPFALPSFMRFGFGGRGSSGLRALIAGRIADRIAAAPPALREQFASMSPAEKEGFLASRAPGLQSLLHLSGGEGEGKFPLLELLQELHPAVSELDRLSPQRLPSPPPSSPPPPISPMEALGLKSEAVPNLNAAFLDNVFDRS